MSKTADSSLLRTKPDAGPPGRAWTMLVLATIGFAVNFWAWALLSPLVPSSSTADASAT